MLIIVLAVVYVLRDSPVPPPLESFSFDDDALCGRVVKGRRAGNRSLITGVLD